LGKVRIYDLIFKIHRAYLDTVLYYSEVSLIRPPLRLTKMVLKASQS